MKVIATAIKDVVIIEPQVFGDDRGYFFESYSQQQFDQAVRPVHFVQDNESHSRYGVLRLCIINITHPTPRKRMFESVIIEKKI